MMPVISRDAAGLVSATRITKHPTKPAPQVFIHHGASPTPAATVKAESAVWKSYQRYHMQTRGWTDIAYNFGVGQSGNSYVGRGWARQGGATGSPQDRTSISICAIGNMSVDAPSDEMVAEIVHLIKWGIDEGHLVGAEDLEILGHRDKPYSTSCPGDKLYGLLSKIQRRVIKSYQVPAPAPEPAPSPGTPPPPPISDAAAVKALTGGIRTRIDEIETYLDAIDKAADDG